MKNINQRTVGININIVDKEAPIFITRNSSRNSDCIQSTINTITLPSIEFSNFKEDELNLLSKRDVFFLLNVDKLETKEAYCQLKKLEDQVKHYCTDTRVISLASFCCVNNIELNENIIDFHDVYKAFNLDCDSFRNLLIYFCTFDSHDLQSKIESLAIAGVDIKEINKFLLCYSDYLHEEL